MICPDCGYDNIDGMDSCEECGQSLVQFDPSGSELEQSITRHPISVLCPKMPRSIEAAVPVGDAVREMLQHKIGCLVVVEGGVLAGIITERDVLNKVSGDLSALERPVSEFMTPSPEVVSEQDTIAFALHAMDLGGYRHMPIVDASGRPRGIISVRDILRFLCVRFADSRAPA